MSYVVQASQEEILNMSIIKPVEHLPSFLTGANEPQLTQAPQMMRDSRLTDSHRIG